MKEPPVPGQPVRTFPGWRISQPPRRVPQDGSHALLEHAPRDRAGQFPYRSTNAYDLRAEIGDLGITPEEFRASVVYRRWVERMPWLAEVGKDG